MLVAGVTGGVGSGKSTFTKMLAARGAEVIDADEIGHRALDPGTPTWHSIVDTFGEDILVAAGMDVDRKRLGEIVFNDREKLAALNAIVHPYIMKTIADTLEALSGTDEIVILDAALIVELKLHGSLDLLIVVTAEDDLRKERLSQQRGMTYEDVQKRIEAQLPVGTLLEAADIVVHNNGTLDELEEEADRVWDELVKRRSA